LIFLAITALTLSIVFTIISSIALFFAIKAWSEVIGLKNSTHQVQYVPIDDKTLEKSINAAEAEAMDSLGLNDSLDEYDEALQ
jgi:hypothetical protein